MGVWAGFFWPDRGVQNGNEPWGFIKCENFFDWPLPHKSVNKRDY